MSRKQSGRDLFEAPTTAAAPIGAKVAHVKAAGQTRFHGCHWPSCRKMVKPAMWGCSQHWYALPKDIRDRIWRAYRAGQEEDMRPSEDYIAAARAAQDWIRNLKPAEDGR